ncbi:tyrosine-type recombinase/integrase [Rhizobium leguminosarum]|nr:tyrosine-type recombinase/integrase [Rhizobium leguminosarum]UIK12473.1 tyrosine-type recombinase/integrase [Rhizobium leguminosarum]UIL29468.1 tyrosine-type recombinase/integrase [Rhizobium leguminosarum]
MIDAVPTRLDEQLREVWHRFNPSMAATAPAMRTKHVASCFFRLCLATLRRSSELSQARLPDVDLEEGVWMIPHAKSGFRDEVPLSPSAVELFRRSIELRGDTDGDLIFPGRWTHLAATRFRKAMPSSDFRLYDIRRAGVFLMLGMCRRDQPYGRQSNSRGDAFSSLRPMSKRECAVYGMVGWSYRLPMEPEFLAGRGGIRLVEVRNALSEWDNLLGDIVRADHGLE